MPCPALLSVGGAMVAADDHKPRAVRLQCLQQPLQRLINIGQRRLLAVDTILCGSFKIVAIWLMKCRHVHKNKQSLVGDILLNDIASNLDLAFRRFWVGHAQLLIPIALLKKVGQDFAQCRSLIEEPNATDLRTHKWNRRSFHFPETPTRTIEFAFLESAHWAETPRKKRDVPRK